jgi:enoyl-CoA hydratase/carnithine racemase
MRKEFNTVIYDEVDNVGHIVINIPPANKMTPDFLIEITEVIEEYALKRPIIGIIIYGNGRSFSSGADVEKLQNFITSSCSEENKEIPDWYIKIKYAFWHLHTANIPVVSAVKGVCIGSGFELALSSNMCIVEKGAMVGFPEVTFDLMPGMSGTIYSIETMGRFKALEFILSGKMVFIRSENDLELVDLVVEKNLSLETASKIISMWSDKGGPSQISKKDIIKLYLKGNEKM